MLRDLLLGIFAGIISGVLSGLIVFWLLSRRLPRIGIVQVTQTDRIRIEVKNARKAGFLLEGSTNSVVQNFAELHIVSSILSDDPPYSRPVRLIQNSPTIIRPQGSFVFVTGETTDLVIRQVEIAKGEWMTANHNVDNIGLRFRLLSRDGFSNTADIVSRNWRVS